MVYRNKVRDPLIAEDLFWQVLSHIQNMFSYFGYVNQYSGLPRRLSKKGVFWVTGAKDSELTAEKTKGHYPQFRLVIAEVDVNGKMFCADRGIEIIVRIISYFEG